MKTLTLKSLAAAILTILSLGQAAHADTVETVNDSDYPMWVTIYGYNGGSQRDWGCVPPKTTRVWASGEYKRGVPHEFRAEIKANMNCSGATLCDTTESGTSETLMIQRTNGKNCAWTLQRR